MKNTPNEFNLDDYRTLWQRHITKLEPPAGIDPGVFRARRAERIACRKPVLGSLLMIVILAVNPIAHFCGGTFCSNAGQSESEISEILTQTLANL